MLFFSLSLGGLRVHTHARTYTQKERQALEDAENEITLADEDDKDAVLYVRNSHTHTSSTLRSSTPTAERYMVGECYVTLDKETIEARVTKMGETVDKEIATLRERITTVEREMAALKGSLYAKFKNAINLETD